MKRLEVIDMVVSYGENTVLKSVDFFVEQGKILAIVGESGSGKSTVLKAVQRLLPRNGKINSGDVRLDGQSLLKCPIKKFYKWRGTRLGSVFQEPGSTLNPSLKIGSQFYGVLKHHKNFDKKRAFKQAVEMMEAVHLKNPEKLLNVYPFQLSGGMQQRVSIAMAMSLNPQFLLADEPTSNLDATVQKRLVDTFLEIKKNFGMGMIVVTHNLALAQYVSDDILVLKDGEVVEFGPKETVISSPQDAYTQQLVKDTPGFSFSRGENMC